MGIVYGILSALPVFYIKLMDVEGNEALLSKNFDVHLSKMKQHILDNNVIDHLY